MINLLISQWNIRVNKWKYCVICHLTFKWNKPFIPIWSYWYDVTFKGNRTLIPIWNDYIVVIKLIWCDHINIWPRPRWLPKQSFKTVVRATDLINLYMLMWSYHCDHIDIMWSYGYMTKPLLTLQAVIKDWGPGKKFDQFIPTNAIILMW